MRSFLFCLAPTLLAYLLLSLWGEGAFGPVLILMVMGAGMAGSSVVSFLHRVMKPKGRATVGKGFLEIVVFFGTALVYLAAVESGCSWIVAATFS